MNILDMSDDEIAKLSPEQFASMASGSEASGDQENQEVKDEPVDEPADEVDESAETQESAPQDPPAEEIEEDDEVKVTPPAETKVEEKKPEQKTAPATASTADVKPDAKQSTETTVDYKAQYEALLAPFKANGRDMQVENVDEARKLMQMGANYNKKMASVKPHLATLRMLEDAGISEEHLNFLIDVHKRVPEAINKLVKDSGIDPMDLSAEKAAGYKPVNHRPADNVIELDQVLEDLKESPKFDQLINDVKQWDRQSQKTVSDHPQILQIINANMESGVYDVVMSEVDKQRTFGKLAGLSDLEAYRQVAETLHASGKFEQAGNKANPQSQQTSSAPAVVQVNPKQADDSKRNEQRRAASPVKAAAPAAKNPDFNPLSMSDEEFAKFKPL